MNEDNKFTAAGSAVEDDAWLQEWARDKFTATGSYKPKVYGRLYGNTDWALARALHADIVAALSAQQSAPEPTEAQIAMLDPWMRPEAARELLRKVLRLEQSAQLVGGDSVSVPRELLRQGADLLDAHSSGSSIEQNIADDFRTLLASHAEGGKV